MLLSTNQSRHNGSALIIGLIICAIMGLTLSSYLLLVRFQRTNSTRSQAWNHALDIAEAGVEEALSQINPALPGPAAVDLSANGWGSAHGGIYGPMNRTLSLGSYSVCYSAGTPLTIYSTGYVTIPALSATIQRVVQVVTTNFPLYSAAIVSINTIDLNGNGIYTDSFNSTDPAHSDNGFYPSAYPSRIEANGDVASIHGVANIGNASISGDLLLGPSAAWDIKNNGEVTGSVQHDFNSSFPPVALPSTTWINIAPSNQSIGGVTYQYAFLNSGDYEVPNLNGNVYVATNAHVRVRIDGDTTLNQLRIAGIGSQSGNLQMYMTGSSFNLQQQTVENGNALNCSYFGLPSNTSLTVGGNSAFTGTIYAPSANMTLNGGGSTVYDMVGSCIVNSAKVNGHFRWHFDENLLAAGPSRGYVVSSWREN